MEFARKNINLHFLILFLACIFNLLILHYQFLLTIALEVDCFRTSVFDNFLACLLDVSMLFFLSWLLTFLRVRAALGVTFVITLLWSFCNVLYARFFHQYLSWSSIGQVGNLTDAVVIDSVVAGFEWIDLVFPLAAILFVWLYVKIFHNDITTKSLRTIVSVWLFTLLMTLGVHSLYFFHPTTGFVYELEKTIFTPSKMDSMWPNWTVFHKGFFRKLVIEPLTRESKVTLTREQKNQIEQEYTDYSLRETERTAPENVNNVIFILVESYLSATSDLIIDGKEITPNLNRLKRDSTVYYNGHMQPNVSIGESSDGQLIYMAGLLPLHSEITVSKARNDKMIGLPELMKEKYPELQSYTIIPTNPTLWDQQAMTDAYGFDKLYSIIDYQQEMRDNEDGGFLTDGMIFAYAAKKDESNKPPFFSLILTMSMHQPYNSFIEHGFQVTNQNLPQEYKNYLNSCHYTDMKIGDYLEKLKAKGLYDNSLIVIASDHDARPRYLGMEGIIKPEIPLYIINGGIDSTNAWDGECNQLDVYTTILDVMGIRSKWRGLGHTLLNKNYQNSVNADVQELSDWIIYSDYFGKEDKE